MGQAPLRLVVLGDSLAFTDHTGPQLPGTPHLWPNVLARELGTQLDREVEAQVIARPGTTVREMWRTVTKDRHVQFEVLLGADAVVVAVGNFDHAPGGVPASLEAVVPYLRPAALRRRVRGALRRCHPVVVRATGGRLRRTPAAEFERLYDGLLRQVRALTQGAPGVVAGPTSHRSAYYARRHPQHPRAQAEQLRLAASHGFPAVAVWPLVEPHAGALNPDGIHWPVAAHAAVGCALAAPLVAQLRGEAAQPGVPW